MTRGSTRPQDVANAIPVAVLAILGAALVVSGCSDDLVCPEHVDTGPTPYISANVAQASTGDSGATHAEVVCTADTLPSLLIAFVNGRTIPPVVPPGGLALVAVLDDDLVLWQPGTVCSLEVTTDYGYATATAVMPEAAAVSAPEAISSGDTLTLFWSAATDADYYEVSAVLSPGAAAWARGNRDTLTLSRTTRETFAVFLPEDVSTAGTISGAVEAVAGPFPEGGAVGNVSGDGWGFFTLGYRDDGSAFEVVVSP
jgi:hypothetical protein